MTSDTALAQLGEDSQSEDVAAQLGIDEFQGSMFLHGAKDPFWYGDTAVALSEKNFRSHPLHYLIQQFLDRCIAARRPCVIQAPPEHGKSSHVIPRLAWEVGRDTSLKIGIVADDTDLSTEHLIRARKLLVSSLHQVAFPGCIPDYERSTSQGEWSKTRLYLRGETSPCFEAFPMRGAVEGHRLDLIFADDIVTRKCMRSAVARNESQSVLLDTLQDRLTDNGAMIVTNNNWHTGDVIHHMRESSAFSTLWIGYEGTKRIGYTVHHPPDNWKLPVHGTLDLWEEQWPEQRLKDRYARGSSSYRRAFEAKDVRPEECRFPEMGTWPRWKEHKEYEGVLFGFLDPFGGKNAKKNDYAALVVVLKTPDDFLDVIHCVVSRLSASQQIKLAFDVYHQMAALDMPRFRALSVEMLPKEENWLKLPFREEKRKRRKAKDDSCRMPLKITNPKENKESRIERLIPLIERGTLRFPADLETRMARNTPDGRSWKLLVEQIEGWPFEAHDDGPDALSGATDVSRNRGVVAFIVEA